MNVYYNRQGEPITFEAFLAQAFEVGYNQEKWERWHRVARTELSDGVTISTVFLVHNHAFMHDVPPLIFETMVFGADGSDEDCRRYSTEAEAMAGHEEVVEKWSRKDLTG